MKTIGFTVSTPNTQISIHDSFLAKALLRRNYQVIPLSWRNFVGADNLFILFRSHWNYHEHHEEFLSWLQYLKSHHYQTGNSVDLVKWNSDKQYLLELSQKKVSVPPSIILHPNTPILQQIDSLASDDIVIKPRIGASGQGVLKKTRSELISWWNDLCLKDKSRGWLIQDYEPSILEGELSVIFFDGHYSHTILKKNQPGEFRVNTQYGGVCQRVTPNQEIIQKCKNVIHSLQEVPLYARIDCVVKKNGEILVFEVEVNEPSLYFSLAPEKADFFAEILHKKLQ